MQLVCVLVYIYAYIFCAANILYTYSVFRFENILYVVNSQSFDFGGVWWVRARGHYVIFTATGRGSWRVKESDGGWERGMFKQTKKREEVIFKSTSRRGATARLVIGPLNGGNLCKNVDNETKRTWWQKKNYKGQPDTWAYRFEIHITEYKFKHNIVYYTHDYTLYECYKIWMELKSLFKATAQNTLF